MKKAQIPKNDHLRLANLSEYRLLDSEPEFEFDRIVKLAAHIAQTSISTITLVDKDRLWFKAKYGIEGNEAPRDISFCAHAINDDKPLIINDARKDERFHDNPFCISDPGVKFYAGFPLITEKGYKLGTLCVYDHRPSSLTDDQIELLNDLALQIVSMFELRLKRFQYDEISDVAKIGHWSFHLETQEIEWSDLMYTLFDMDRDNGSPSYDEFKAKIYEEDVAQLESCVANTIENKTSYTIQHRVKFRDGQLRWVEGHGEPILDANKNVIGINGVCQDISEKISYSKEVESYQKDLKEKNTYLKLALDGAGLGIWDWYLEDNSVKFDENWAKMLGYDLSEIEMSLSEWESRVHPDDIESCYADIKAYMNGETKRYENTHRMRHKDGHWLYILDQGSISDWDDSGKPIRFTGTHLDITKSKMQEEQIIKTTKELQVINKLLKIDRSLETHIDDKLNLALLYISETPWLNKDTKAAIFLNKDDHLRIIASKGIDSNVDLIKVEDNHFKIDILDDAYYEIPIIGQGDNLLGVMVFYIDKDHDKSTLEKNFLRSCSDVISQIITAYNFELDIIAKRDEALAGEKAKSEFLANMSHEIRTPMNSLLGMIDMLYETRITKAQKEYLDMAKNGGDHLLSILNDILDISKIDSGKLELESVNFSLHECLRNIISIHSFNAKKKNVEIKYELGQDDFILKGDIVRIRQILDNFVTNAIKFSENGEVILGYKILGQDDKNIELDLFVKDSGIGLSSSQIEKLFQTFSQADSSITRKYGGSGLGLSICKKLAQLMGGRVYVKSKEGKGSTFGFVISLPLAKSMQENDEVTHEDEIDKNISILVVEDNVMNQKLMHLMLKSLGLKCEIAANGQIALDMIENFNNTFDIIFMDIQMPEMDGYTATKKILEKYGDDSPVIIAQTANAFKEDREKCLEMGMQDFISKPIKKKDLKALILKYNRKKAA
jgi:PAS domain S-box-containing protein